MEECGETDVSPLYFFKRSHPLGAKAYAPVEWSDVEHYVEAFPITMRPGTANACPDGVLAIPFLHMKGVVSWTFV